MPSTLAGFAKHSTYMLETNVKEWETLWPRTKADAQMAISANKREEERRRQWRIG
jgi:hypothetical protein